MAIDSIKISGTLLMCRPGPATQASESIGGFGPCSPAAWKGCVPLEPRLLLSAESARAPMRRSNRTPDPTRAPSPQGRSSPHKRLTPAQEINAQYAHSRPDLTSVLNDYVNSINEQSTSTVSVSATVTAALTLRRPQSSRSTMLPFSAPRTFDPASGCERGHRHGLTRSIHSLRQLGKPADCQSTQPLTVVFARWHRSDSQRSDVGAESASIDLPQLHHRQHDSDGHQSGAVLQQSADQAAARECAAAHARSARRDPDLRVSKHRRHHGPTLDQTSPALIDRAFSSCCWRFHCPRPPARICRSTKRR